MISGLATLVVAMPRPKKPTNIAPDITSPAIQIMTRMFPSPGMW